MTERTYLRVRRRRNAVAALKIQLDGILLEQDEDDFGATPATECSPLFRDGGRREHGPVADHLVARISSGRPPSKRSKKAVWRRVSVSDNDGHALFGDAHHHHGNRKRNYRVVDAILHDVHVDDGNEDEAGSHKRRRLTLIQTSTDGSAPWGRSSRNENLVISNSSTSARRGAARPVYRILPPNERLVDDSLKQVFAGKRLVAEHYDLCGTDPRLAEEHRDRWLSYRNEEHGNLLHACALWNDAAVASELALNARDRHGNRDGHLDSMIHAQDGDGRTPLQVAELCGNDAVVGVLRYATGDGDEDDDDDSFAYDVYCLDGEISNAMGCLEDVDGGGADAVDTSPLDCELEGGVGYWDESGQLVLDMLPPRTTSEVSVADEDEFDDQNHEDWNGNDYPEDEDVDGYILSDEDDDDFERANMRRAHGMESDEEGNVDAAYGIYGNEEDDVAAYAYEDEASAD